jgi:hypothetical protein
MTDCLAPHLPKPQPNHKQLIWLQTCNDPRYRALAWTCHCADVIYELRAAGGQTYLCRTDLNTGKVLETHRMGMREGHAIWQALLSGRVL